MLRGAFYGGKAQLSNAPDFRSFLDFLGNLFKMSFMKQVVKRSLLALLAFVLLSGCFETRFNFQTRVSPSGAIEREVQIDGSGANRFLPPKGAYWSVKTFESKEGKSFFDDTSHHIHAKGKVAGAHELTHDFRFDASRFVENLSPAARVELTEQLNILEPISDHLGTGNPVMLKRSRSIWTTQYEYREVFEIRGLVPILLLDLMKEIERQNVVENVVERAQKKLVSEFLPEFRFHSEVTLPGKIFKTNASRLHERTAIWDFNGTDFEDDFSRFEIFAVSRTLNYGLLGAILALALGLLAAIALGRRRKKTRRRGKRA
jgi:hypothetical protein